MADKISTIVLKVDLECERCYKKIRKVLCKIQDKMNIKTISFDEKSNTVTISGPFDAEMVCNKLCCKAGRVIKEMDVKGKEKKDAGKAKDGGGEKPKDAGKAEKEGAKAAEKKEEKAEKKEGRGDKDAKPDKAEKGNKDGKAGAKKVKFDLDGGAPAADAKPGMTKADLGPLLEKIMAAKAGPEPPRGEPIAPPPMMAPRAAQGVAVPSIWPVPAGSVSGYGYNPGYDYSTGAGGYGCGCGGYNGYCRCGKPAAPGGYYGVPVYDSQGWYYGGGGARQLYYPQQQHCCEDPNAGCSVM
ncbi:protein PYRICULARIA ORYZAE RESISTANCE 21-like [Miscanthus floridulus]|uniref:protein PYRICULARIA ORYZAE RESISTANCE 21-like n=1 Tax=Miscanthus floridulus TaxID=154761 RepID=UPI003459FF7D